MKSYRCKYESHGTTHWDWVTIEAETDRDAYEAYLKQTSYQPAKVFVEWGSLLLGGSSSFVDHKAHAELEAKRSAAEIQRVKTKANQEAQSSLSPTEKLLKKLIAEQRETNQWLRKIRWSIWCILLILAIWNLFGWRIIPIR